MTVAIRYITIPNLPTTTACILMKIINDSGLLDFTKNSIVF
jgi:hypothetical protein